MALHGKAHERRIEALRNLVPFGTKQDSIKGLSFPSGTRGAVLDRGVMPAEIRREFHDAIVVYVVYSYSTPIAWVTDGGVVVNPQHRYSVTTTQHQSACRQHLAMNKQRVEGQV